jgi:hypothetical protein
VSLEIYDALDKLHRKLTRLAQQVKLEGFATQGVYVGRLITRDNGVQTIKFIVSH